jgi:uncharacterized membrane protein
VGLTFLYILIAGIASTTTQFGEIFTGSSFTTLAMFMTGSGVLLTLLALPLQYGYYVAYLNSSRQDLPADIGDLFCGYKRFWKVLGTFLLMILAIIGGFILLVVPGIILCFGYAMVPYVLRDNPELSCTETLAKSREMMKGHKWELFVLYLSFIGWAILCVFTFFIGFLWLTPYMQMTETKFYEKIRAEYEGIGEEDMPMQEEAAPADVIE